MPIHESGEDYLETIYLLSQKGDGVHAVDIANEMKFSKPSVTKAMKILKERGFITIEANHIRLTEEGETRALEIYDRHKTITKFLMLNGVSPQSAAKDACRMEHDISEETFEAFKRLIAEESAKKAGK